jgi:hypothetical protein
LLDDYLAIASLALFAFIGISIAVDPKAAVSLVAQARPSVKEALQDNESEVLAVTRFIGGVFVAIASLIFVTFVLMRGR